MSAADNNNPQTLSADLLKALGPYQEFYLKLNDEQNKATAELAKQNSFTIHLGKSSGRKVEDPISGEQVEMYDSFEEKVYERRKILQRDWKRLKIIESEETKERDPLKKSEHTEKKLRAGAFYFLGMTKEEWDRVDIAELKSVVEACMLRTEYPLPYSAKT